MPGGGGAGEIVDLIDFEPNRLRYIVPDQLETVLFSTPAYISFVSRIKIINAQDFVPEFEQDFAQVRP